MALRDGQIPLMLTPPIPPPSPMLALEQVTIDNCTSMTHTVLQICCRDRKGLLYDIMRTIKDNSLRVTYAKVLLTRLAAAASPLWLVRGSAAGVRGLLLLQTTDRRLMWLVVRHDPRTQVAVKQNNTCFADVFVQEAVHKARITDAYILHWLVEKIRTAVANPFTVSTKDVYDGLYTELKVVAPVDSGGRGRPKVRWALQDPLVSMMRGSLRVAGCHLMLSRLQQRSACLPPPTPPSPSVADAVCCCLLHQVTYDVTHGLSTMRVCVFMAEIQIEKVMNQYQEEELQVMSGLPGGGATKQRGRCRCALASLMGFG